MSIALCLTYYISSAVQCQCRCHCKLIICMATHGRGPWVQDAVHGRRAKHKQAAHRQAAVLHHVVVRRLVHEARQRREGAASFEDSNQYITIVPDSASSPGEVEVQGNGLQLLSMKTRC
jgi:hypothetical protein